MTIIASKANWTKALVECILQVLFVLLLKRVLFLVNSKPKDMTIQMKALGKYMIPMIVLSY